MAARRTRSQSIKISHPVAAEFFGSCRTVGFQEDDVITAMLPILSKSENSLRITNLSISSGLSKAFLRLIQKYTKFQSVTFFASPILDFSFFKQLSTDLIKINLPFLAFDYMPIPREFLTPFLSLPLLETFSIRGNQCLTSYDYDTHEPSPFPVTLNLFFNALCTSHLKNLNLYGCHIGDDGASALAETLFFNTSLKCLNLSKNRIGNNGAIKLAFALGQYVLNENELSILQSLMKEDSKHKITEEGGNFLKKKKGSSKAPAKKPPPKQPAKKGSTAKAPAEKVYSFDPNAQVSPVVLFQWSSSQTLENNVVVIPGNKTVSTLLLDDNRVGSAGYNALKEMLQINTTLKIFSIRCNPEIKKVDADAIEKNIEVADENPVPDK